MADLAGKCTNYGGCALAYRNEPIAASGNFVCPECGQPLQEAIAEPARSRKPLLVVGAITAAVVLIAGGIFIDERGQKTKGPLPDRAEAPPSAPASEGALESAPATTPGAPPDPIPVPPPVARTEETPPPPPATEPEPPVDVSAEQSVDVNPSSAENQRVRQEVLSRIDAMPNLTEANKVKLYDRVNGARRMGRIITIPFATGSITLAPRAVDQLSTVVRAPQITSLLDDPTAVFVVLGFADTRGDAKANLKVSLARAENVIQALRQKSGLQNVMQAVGMGGSGMFDAGDHARNRVVEVWVVLP